MKLDVPLHAQPLVKIQQIDTAPQQNMLAVVDGFAIPDLVGSSSPPQERPRLKDLDPMPRPTESRSRREPSQPPADNDYLSHRLFFAASRLCEQMFLKQMEKELSRKAAKPQKEFLSFLCALSVLCEK